MPLVVGVDSSTQSCKIVVCDAATGTIVRQGSAPHPDGTEADPEAWWHALLTAITAAGGLDDVSALAVGGQQHGMIVLDASGRVIRPALLWNDTRSSEAAQELTVQFPDIVARTGTLPLASFTATQPPRSEAPAAWREGRRGGGGSPPGPSPLDPAPSPSLPLPRRSCGGSATPNLPTLSASRLCVFRPAGLRGGRAGTVPPG